MFSEWTIYYFEIQTGFHAVAFLNIMWLQNYALWLQCCMSQEWATHRSFANSTELISPPVCGQFFFYLYKNSFCTVLLEKRVFDIWLFCKAARLLLSFCARVAKMTVTCVFFLLLIEIRFSFLVFSEFEYVNFFFFF